MEVQAKVDSNHPDARVEEGPDHLFGKTLEQEERIEALIAVVIAIGGSVLFDWEWGAFLN